MLAEADHGAGTGVGSRRSGVGGAAAAAEDLIDLGGDEQTAGEHGSIVEHGIAEVQHAVFAGTEIAALAAAVALAASSGKGAIGGIALFVAHAKIAVLNAQGMVGEGILAGDIAAVGRTSLSVALFDTAEALQLLIEAIGERGLVLGLEVEHAGGSGVAAEVHATGRQVDGKLWEPDGPVPMIGPDGNVDEEARVDAGSEREAEVIDRVAEFEVAVVDGGVVGAEIDGLAAGGDGGGPVEDLVGEGELEFVGVEVDVDGGEDLAAGNAEVEDSAEKVELIEDKGRVDAGGSGCGRREGSIGVGSGQPLGEVDTQVNLIAAAKDGEVDAVSGIGADLGDEFLAVEELIVGEAGGQEVLGIALDGLVGGGHTGLGRVIGVDDVVVPELSLNGEAKAEAIIESGPDFDGVSGGAADDAPVDGDVDFAAPLVVVAEGEAGKEDVGAQVDVGDLIATGTLAVADVVVRRRGNDAQEPGEGRRGGVGTAAYEGLAGGGFGCAGRGAELFSRMGVVGRFNAGDEGGFFETLRGAADELVAKLGIVEGLQSGGFVSADLSGDLRAPSGVGESLAEFDDVFGGVSVFGRAVALEGCNGGLAFAGIGNVARTAGLAEFGNALGCRGAGEAGDSGAGELHDRGAVRAFAEKDAIAENLMDDEALIDFADVVGFFLDLDVLGHGMQTLGDVGEGFGIVEHRGEVEMRFAESDLGAGADRSQRILAQDVEALHGGAIGIAEGDGLRGSALACGARRLGPALCDSVRGKDGYGENESDREHRCSSRVASHCLVSVPSPAKRYSACDSRWETQYTMGIDM